MSNQDQLNITIIGDPNVGKDNLVYTLIGPTESYNNPASDILLDCKLNITTLSGNESDIKYFPKNLKDTDVILVCYDVSSKASYDHACNVWLKEANKYCFTHLKSPTIMLVGLQSAQKKPEVEVNDVNAFVVDKGIDHQFVEADNAEKVRRFFANIVAQHPATENIFQKQDEFELKIKKESEKNLTSALAIKIGAGLLLAAAMVTASVFLWPVIVGSAAIVAAAAAISAITVAHLGVALGAGVLAATMLATASAAIMGFGSFLISKLTNRFHKATPVVPQVDGFADLNSDLLDHDQCVKQEPVFISTHASLAKNPVIAASVLAIDEEEESNQEYDINSIIDEDDSETNSMLNGKTNKEIIAEALAFIDEDENFEKRKLGAK